MIPALLLLACDPLSAAREAESRWRSAAALAEDPGLQLAAVSSGEALPPTLRVSLFADHAIVDNRAWLLSLPEAREDPASLAPLLQERELPLVLDGPPSSSAGLSAPLQALAELQFATQPDAPDWAGGLLVAPDAGAPAGLVLRALYGAGQAGRSSYQIVGRAGDRPVGVLASRAGAIGARGCLGQVALRLEPESATLRPLIGSLAPGACAALGRPEEAAVRDGLLALASACQPRWAAWRAIEGEGSGPPEAWACLRVAWGASVDTPLRAGALVSAISGITAAQEPVAVGPAMFVLEEDPEAGCAELAALDALSAAGLDALCGADAAGRASDAGAGWGAPPRREQGAALGALLDALEATPDALRGEAEAEGRR